ncbi:hypothetical protein QNM99_27135 [Pseudomonas sp. PCH446]
MNFHLDTLNKQGVVRASDQYRSPDAMRQDGSWHLLDVNRIVRTDYQGAVTFEFVFDRSVGGDTRCAAHKTYQWPVPRPRVPAWPTEPAQGASSPGASRIRK